MRKAKNTCGITAWLVTWEHMGDHAKLPPRRIAAVLNYRWSPQRVREMVEILYVNAHYTPGERIAYAKSSKRCAPQVITDQIHGVPWPERMWCGQHPWLYARLVDELRTPDDFSEETDVTWVERSRPTAQIEALLQAKEPNARIK